MFEVYQGEVYKSGPADFEAVDGALSWVTVIDETRDLARTAAELQNELVNGGTPLSARDAFIAGAAESLDERLAVADADFRNDDLTDRLDVDLL
jgi:predicted nucleic acid-binding protein